MRQNRRRIGSKRSANDKIKHMRMAAILLIIALALVAVILMVDRKPLGKEASAPTDMSFSSDEGINISGGNSAAPDDSGMEPDNNQYIMDFSQYELKKDEIPQVNQLTSEYFQAKVNQDVQTLYRIFGKSDDTGLDTRKEELKNEAVYIEDHADIVYYTKPGLTEDSYVAYVIYEVKFRRVETLAPGLMWCYVVKDDNGNYTIRKNVAGDEVDYVAKQNQSEDVKSPSNQVNERLRQVIENDTALAGIYKDLRNGVVVHSSEEETETGDSTVILEEEGGKIQENGGPQPSQDPSADTGQNSQGEGIQNVPVGQEDINARENEGIPAAAQENQRTDSGTAGGSGTEESVGTAGDSSTKIGQAWRIRLTMNVKDFDYELPEELIAQDSLEGRSASRLTILDRETGEIQHRIFKDITEYLRPGDCPVINDTKVIPVRLFGVKKDTGAETEILLLKRRENDVWETLVRPGKKVKPGTVTEFGEGLLTGTVVDTADDGDRLIQLHYKGIFEEILDQLGQVPLSPYITHQLKDKNRYRTVCTRHEGSVVVPTVGLHFIQELLVKIERMGVKIAHVILHVGPGTFRLVKAENVQDHHMYSEFYIVEESGTKKVNDTRMAEGRAIYAGTVSCRTVESASTGDGVLKVETDWTEIFIYPGYHFKVLDALTTNFHLPQSTLAMLVSALAGREHILDAYREAMKEGYRFFPFGDAMLIVAHPAAKKQQGLRKRQKKAGKDGRTFK